jgi:hypothetical protein
MAMIAVLNFLDGDGKSTEGEGRDEERGIKEGISCLKRWK